MEKFRISITGDLGSGKSTVMGILSSRHEVTRVSTGVILRKLAQEEGMTIEEFNRHIEGNPAYDKKIDDYLASYESVDGNFIFDSRLAWHFVPSTLSFYLKVDPRVAAERVFNAGRADEGYKSVDEALDKLTARRKSEALRYKNFYGLDILNLSNYDCVIDTTSLTPEEVARAIEERVEKG